MTITTDTLFESFQAPAAPICRGHWVAVTWRHHCPLVDFFCNEPPDSWCQRHVVGPGEESPKDPAWCWFTILAQGSAWLDIYSGHPAEIDPVHCGAVEFQRTRPPDGSDECEWPYIDPEGKTS
jgi:hypothetical protein